MNGKDVGSPVQPNIVLILTDQQQAGMMGCAGHPRVRTPAMNRLAAEGCRFTHAFCTTPQCSPSRASLFTGLYPHRHGLRGNVRSSFAPTQLPTDLPSLGTILRTAGYHAAYFGKWHLGAKHEASSNPLAYGFEHYVASRLLSEGDTEDDLADEAAAYLSSYAQPHPLLLVASFNDPHGVYALKDVDLPGVSMDISLPSSFGDDLSTKPRAQRIFRDEDQPASLPLDRRTAQRYLAWYTFMTERADGYLDRMLRSLDSRPDLANNTVVIFTSDHGDLGCAHSLPFKGPCMYEELIGVPLLIRGPGLPQRRTVNNLVTLADILPTICDLTSIPQPAEQHGKSMVSLLHDQTGNATWRDAVIGQYHGKQRWASPIRMLRTARHKLTLYCTGERELYDLADDPHEMVNLAGRAHVASLEATLMQRLQRWMDEYNDPFAAEPVTDRCGARLRSP